MGMYTELNFGCEIKGAPEFVIKTLRLMVDGCEDKSDWPEETKHFLDSRIAWMFNGASFYHHPVASSKLVYLDYCDTYYLSARFNIKNYENEIEEFIEWLTPFMTNCDDEFLGYKRYEEARFPTLLYHPNKWVSVKKGN